MTRRLSLAVFLAFFVACLPLAGSAQAADASGDKDATAKPDAKKAGTDTNLKAGQQAKTPAKPSSSQKKAVVTDVQVYSGRDYSRIVVVLSGEAGRRWQLLPPDPKDGGVRRLYVDMDETVVRAGVPSRFDVRGDVARKVRLAPFKPGVTRLVVEVENLKNQNVFVMENPYRVIVDVQGEASRKEPGKESPKDQPKAQAGKAGIPLEKSGKKGSSPVVQGEKPGSPGVNLATPERKKMAKQLVEQLGLTVRTVMVDAGHGGRDSGARGVGGLYEKNVTLEVAKLLGKHLEKMGFEVLYTRTTDKYVPLEMRTAMANARKADLFVSVHCNAHGNPNSSGMETYSLNLASTPDEVRVAARENAVDPRRISDMQKILDELMHASKLTESREFAKSAHQTTLSQARKSLNLRDRGVHEAPFYVLLGAKMPAILVEIGYITNPSEGAKLKDEKYLDGLAKGIAEGVKGYKERIERFADKN
ncbi:MAG: N-acetylmuramoyl-L-alanine amidase [Desulfovibrio sp.]|nr:N-acetylmuramoyl-L-alanine amidase [Desulfovibrio sp.]MBI4959803.1 N-acetylmuramoyl-L-alanine amidase [Desulfovibrio sp.]